MMIKYRQYRWAARLSGILGMVFFISYFTSRGLAGIDQATATTNLTFILLLFSLCLIAYVLSWFIEIVGGTLLTMAAILLPLYVYYNEGISLHTSLYFYGLPFLIPGLLFIIAWRIKLIRKIAPDGYR
jgi:hypothetical protein